jgi:hypothetical protein
MRYDAFAQRLESEYSLFLYALTGRYLSLMAPGAGVSPMLIDELERGAWALRKTFLATANQSVSDYLGSSTLDSVKTLASEFADELERATWQNVTMLASRMKGVKSGALDAVSHAHGAIGLLLQRKLATPEFVVTAMSGRTFKAAPFIRAQARQFAYQSDLRMTMAALSESGDLARVAYDDPTHEHYGIVFSMSGTTPGYPSFDDLAEFVFHYNASARITPHVSP